MAKKKKKNRALALCTIAAVILLLLLLSSYIAEFVSCSTTEGESVTVIIPQGSSSGEIGKILKDAGLVRSVNIFKVRAKSSANGAKMNYGTFNLHKGMCIPDIIDTLAGTYAYKDTVTFTVPEGFSIQQIAKRAEDLGICSKEELLAAAENDEYDYDFLKDIPKDGTVDYALQGFLYPETYEFFKNAAAHEVIDKMLAQFEKEIRNVKKPKDKSWHEIVTVASLLEREALWDKEMPTIAGVIYNRIDKNMRLQVDATVQYAVTKGEYNINRVTYKDLEVESPYNTYKVSGLPVGPISSVSVAAIKAACNPEKHSYLYYHTDPDKNDGSHIFTKTYEEHLATMK